MNHRKFILLLSFTMYLLLGVGVVYSEDYEVVKKGVLDLTKWNFETQGSYDLEGEWEFYWGKLLTPKDFKEGVKAEGYIYYPKEWKLHEIDGKPLENDGYATYRARIKVPKGVSRLGLEVPQIYSAGKIFVNGILEGERGVVTKIQSNYIPASGDMLIMIHDDVTVVDIVLQISNYNYINFAGTYESMEIGDYNFIKTKRSQSEIFSSIFVGVFVTLGIYFLLIRFQYKSSQTLMYFGLFCLFVALRSASISPFLLIKVFPDISWELVRKVEFAGFYLSIVTFVGYIFALFPKEGNHWLQKIISIPVFIAAVTVVVTDVAFFAFTMNYVQIYTLVSSVIPIYMIITATVRKREDSGLLAIGVLTILLVTFHDVLVNMGVYRGVLISDVGILVFMGIQAFIISRRVARNSREIEEQNVVLRQEIVERKRARKQLEIFLKFADSATEGFGMTNLQGKIMYTNAALDKILGFENGGNIIGDKLSTYYDDSSRTSLEETYFPQLLKKDSVTFDAVIDNNNIERDVRQSIFTIYDDDERPYRLAMVVSDITDQKMHECALHEAIEKAEESNRVKSEFLANMSHELRTPMHGILSYAKFGIDRIEKVGKEKILSYFENIKECGDSLMTLLNDLLDLSKLESGQTDYTFEKCGLDQAIQSAIRTFDTLLKDKNITLKYEEPSYNTEILHDSGKIIQVFVNIISNAIKFSKPGSTVEIKVEDHEETIRVAVVDEGIGIPANELDTIFDKFIQSSKSKSGAGGTGLGLSISKKIISDHDGRIWAERNPKGGSIFIVELQKLYELKNVA